jgi:HNH endonuclease
MANSLLTQERLRSLLDYDPATGAFTWLVDRRGRFARKGARAGTINGNGYRQISIDCVIYPCARLAVLWMTGRWPKRLVDHHNRDKIDDRWDNLRPATYSQNGANSADR